MIVRDIRLRHDCVTFVMCERLYSSYFSPKTTQEDTKRKRFYGYTVGNIFSMMERESKTPRGGSDAITRSELVCRLKKLMTGLEKYGYNIKVRF